MNLITSMNAHRVAGKIAPQPALLQADALSVAIPTRDGRQVRAVDRVSFAIGTGESVGIVGESGSGKSTLLAALLRSYAPGAQVTGGTLLFKGRDLFSISDKELRKLRGGEIAMIFQDSCVLNPVIRVGDQIAEVLYAHSDLPLSRCRDEAKGMLEAVDLRSTDVYAAFPHQLSGGQRQRIVIACALVCRPSLVLADEPTASLDGDTAVQILDLLLRLKERMGSAIVLTSHDPLALKLISDRILVMYAGQLVETGTAFQVLQEPQHPYTRALLACATPGRRQSLARGHRQPLPTIPGNPPDLLAPFTGCCFESRCGERFDLCKVSEPALLGSCDDYQVRCFAREGR